MNKTLYLMLSLPLLSACENIPVDGQLHIGAGSIAYVVQSKVLPDRLNETPLERCAAAIGAGVAKEVYDKVSGKGNPEFRDAANTALGCLVTDFVVQSFN